MAVKMVVLAKFTVEEVLPFIDVEDSKEFSGQLISMTNPRLVNFKRNGCKCVVCGKEGNMFSLERHNTKHDNPDKYHFNLYHIDKGGAKHLMTKDHIIPRSRGGADHIDNYQPMCSKCNSTKGHYMPGDKILPITQKPQKMKNDDLHRKMVTKVGDILCKGNRKKFQNKKRIAEVVAIGFKWIPYANYKVVQSGRIVPALWLKGMGSQVCCRGLTNDKSEIKLMRQRDLRDLIYAS